jgi:DNA-directed RNA polymerase subunit H (RpoH/RPB5)
MSSKRILELLKIRKDELMRSRGRGIVFLDKISEASYLGEDREIEEDIVVINHEKKQGVRYYSIGEIEIIPLLNIIINPLEANKDIVYKLITGKELEELLDRGLILPSILFSDPMRIWKGWKAGDIIKIIRPDKSIYYRRVKKQ